MIQVNLFVGSRYPVNRKKIRKTVISFLEKNKINHVQVDVSIVGKRKIKKLNESELKHEGTTDVLSFPQHKKKQLDDFPMPEGIPPHLGDVVVSFPAAVTAAKKFGKLVDDQICFLIEHSLLHLMGYHHQ